MITSQNTSKKTQIKSLTVKVLQETLAAQTREYASMLAQDYEIINPKEVAEFIGKNLFLLDLLREIPKHIKKHFGKTQNLTLRFFLDPEDFMYHRLIVGIPTKSENQKSATFLQKFDENWWLDNERKSQSKILIDLESAR